MGERILTILLKEFRSVFRDPRMRMVIFGLPVIQTLIFGYAVTMDVRHVRLVDHRPRQTRPPAARWSRASPARTISTSSRTPTTSNRARALIDAAERQRRSCRSTPASRPTCAAGRTAPVQLHRRRLRLQHRAARAQLRPPRSPPATTTRSCSSRRCAGPAGPFASAAWTSAPAPGSTKTWRAATISCPGVMAMLVMLVSLMLTSMAIVREKEVGTIEQIMVTPIRPVEFILGKCAPFAVIGFVDVALVTARGRVLVRHPDSRQLPLLLLLGTALLPAEHPRHRPVHLDRERDPAAGDDDDLLLLFPGDAALRLHLSRSPTCPR